MDVWRVTIIPICQLCSSSFLKHWWRGLIVTYCRKIKQVSISAESRSIIATVSTILLWVVGRQSLDVLSCNACRQCGYYGHAPSCVNSVRPSVCHVPPPRGKTKRPTNTKLGRKGPWDTSTPRTNFKVKGSKVKVTAASCVVNFAISMFIVYYLHRVVDKTIDYFVLLRY